MSPEELGEMRKKLNARADAHEKLHPSPEIDITATRTFSSLEEALDFMDTPAYRRAIRNRLEGNPSTKSETKDSL